MLTVLSWSVEAGLHIIPNIVSIREPGINGLFSSFAGSIALKFHAEVAFLGVLLFICHIWMHYLTCSI